MRAAPPRALVIALLVTLAAACRRQEQRHEHAADHPEGHDHHADNHGHGEVPMVHGTYWSDRFEAFIEHPPAVAGAEVEVLTHWTVLDGFRPLRSGAVELELNGPARIHAKASAPERPGIYRLKFKAGPPGSYTGSLRVHGSEGGAVPGVLLQVAESAAKARAGVKEAEHGPGEIEFLKEQQWGVPFATEFARNGTLVASLEVAGAVDTPPGGSAEVGAPVAGKVVPLGAGLPHPGDPVVRGQVLATLQPAPSSPEDAARASLEVSEAEARTAAARSALERAERLIRDEAISTRELEDARREAELANEALKAARRVQGLFARASAGASGAGWRLNAPIDGTLVSVSATPGASVSPGQVLFRIVDLRQLWIRARVPEQDAPRIRTDRAARYRVSGTEEWRTIDISAGDGKAKLVTVGRVVDPLTRTVDVIYSLADPDPNLRVGGLVQVSVPAGPDFNGVVVPNGAIVDQDGRELAYVQVDGEHFLERTIRTGARAGDSVAVVEGLRAGERIVTRGAHLVRLADRSKATEAHGHVH